MSSVLIPVIAVIVVFAIFWLAGQNWAGGRNRFSDQLEQGRAALAPEPRRN